MGGILDHLRAEHQRALRAEADADRLAEVLERYARRDDICHEAGVVDVLIAHDKEVEAR